MGHRRPDAAHSDDLIRCLEPGCGWEGKSLGPHLRFIHDMLGAEYRQRHGLPATAVLSAPVLRRTLRAVGDRRMAENPDAILDVLRAGARRGPTARSAEVRARTDALPAVREARRRGALAQHAQRDAERDARAQALGFDSWAGAIDATRTRPVREVTALLGISKSGLSEWRRRTPGAKNAPDP